jgi:hypothetical protein
VGTIRPPLYAFRSIVHASGRRRWVPKWQRDAAIDGSSPLPTRVVSNEDSLPLPQTPQQAEVAARLGEAALSHARRLGMSRRGFLASSSGMAAGFLALNAVFGRFFEVDPVEALVMRDDCTGIEGMEPDEAEALIAALADHIVKPAFVYRHRWRPGDVLMWDNCTVQHRAIQDYEMPQRRLMHRTTMGGAVPA